MDKEKVSKILEELKAEPFPFRALLYKFNLSQRELGDYMCVCQGAVSKWCKLTPPLTPHNEFNLYMSVLIMTDVMEVPDDEERLA